MRLPVRKENTDSLNPPQADNIKKQARLSSRTSRISFTYRIEGVFFYFIGRFRLNRNLVGLGTPILGVRPFGLSNSVPPFMPSLSVCVIAL